MNDFLLEPSDDDPISLPLISCEKSAVFGELILDFRISVRLATTQQIQSAKLYEINAFEAANSIEWGFGSCLFDQSNMANDGLVSHNFMEFAKFGRLGGPVAAGCGAAHACKPLHFVRRAQGHSEPEVKPVADI